MASVAAEVIVIDRSQAEEEVSEESMLIERIRTRRNVSEMVMNEYNIEQPEKLPGGRDLGLEGLDISELVTSVVNRQHILPSLNYHVANSDTIASTEEVHQVISKTEIINVAESVDLAEEEEESDEEVIELEFERAVEKVHTHTPYCPKCNSQITKVTLRRKIPKKKKKKKIPSPPVDDEPVDLLGCLSCFSIFTPSSGNKLSPFRIFGWKRKPDIAKPVEDDVTGEKDGTEEPSHEAEGEETVSPQKPVAGEHVAIPIDDVTDTALVLQRRRSVRKLDILKCIVYGGLVESIASLSVVSSAAASDVPTLNIVAIGLAILVSSLVIFGQNILELKKEHQGPDSATNKYQQLLGESKDNFLVHATFSILSFLVFGLVPPVIYGFAFRESDNKPYKIIAVAVASFVCVCVLATAKAYLERCQGLKEYVKTVSYYVALVIAGSGVGYAVGDLIKILLERLRLFDFGLTNLSGTIASNAEIGTWMSYR